MRLRQKSEDFTDIILQLKDDKVPQLNPRLILRIYFVCLKAWLSLAGMCFDYITHSMLTPRGTPCGPVIKIRDPSTLSCPVFDFKHVDISFRMASFPRLSRWCGYVTYNGNWDQSAMCATISRVNEAESVVYEISALY